MPNTSKKITKCNNNRTTNTGRTANKNIKQRNQTKNDQIQTTKKHNQQTNRNKSQDKQEHKQLTTNDHCKPHADVRNTPNRQ